MKKGICFAGAFFEVASGFQVISISGGIFYLQSIFYH